jgi:HSP20 family protein
MSDFGPYLEFVRIQTEMNKLFESLQELRDPGVGPDQPEGGWVPNVDICETADTLVVEAEVPGVDPASLVVKVHGGNLTLEGVKQRMRSEDEGTFHRRDRGCGPFRRAVPLSAPVNTHRAEARLDRGLLRILFPKVPNKRGEAIEIPVRSGDE